MAQHDSCSTKEILPSIRPIHGTTWSQFYRGSPAFIQTHTWHSMRAVLRKKACLHSKPYMAQHDSSLARNHWAPHFSVVVNSIQPAYHNSSTTLLSLGKRRGGIPPAYNREPHFSVEINDEVSIPPAYHKRAPHFSVEVNVEAGIPPAYHYQAPHFSAVVTREEGIPPAIDFSINGLRKGR